MDASSVTYTIKNAVRNFIIDRRVRGCSANTIRYYTDELTLLTKWLDAEGVSDMGEVDADLLREFFLDLGQRRNKGGVHSVFRSVKAFFNWWVEEEGEDTPNPILKVKVAAPKTRALPGVPISDIQRMIEACTGPMAKRDQTMLRVLLDTGARAFEFVALNLGDVDLTTGAVRIQRGKGDKERTVFIGQTCRRELRRYVRTRTGLNPSAPLWPTDEGDRLSIRGLRAVVQRRSEAAGVSMPGLHDFRRAFALNMWRNGVDLLTISRLMGHSSLEVTRRYIAQFEQDLKAGHALGSPVDRASL